MDDWRIEMRDLAERQHGVVATWQLPDGISPSALHREQRRGVWERRHARLLALRGAPRTDRATLIAAVLGAGRGAVASHDSAAALWGLPQFRLLPPHVSKARCRNGTQPDGSIRHESRKLPVDHLTVLDGIPVTRPERTLVDLAASIVSPRRLGQLTDHLMTERMVTPAAIRRIREDLSARGRSGLRLVDEVLDDRPHDYVPPATTLESRVEELVRRWGQTVRRQVPLDAGDRIARVDFVTEPDGVVIEVQSERWHSSLSDRVRDEARIAGLRAQGHEVVEVWENDVWHDRVKVQTEVRDAVRRARVRRGVA